MNLADADLAQVRARRDADRARLYVVVDDLAAWADVLHPAAGLRLWAVRHARADYPHVWCVRVATETPEIDTAALERAAEAYLVRCGFVVGQGPAPRPSELKAYPGADPRAGTNHSRLAAHARVAAALRDAEARGACAHPALGDA